MTKLAAWAFCMVFGFAFMAPSYAISAKSPQIYMPTAINMMLKRFGFNASEVNDGLEQARNEFKGALQELFASPQNTPAIRKELELARMQWVFFENALAQESVQHPAFAVNVATSSERILEVMDRVTGMYENL